MDNVKEARHNHYIVLVSFLGKISDPTSPPEVYMVPSVAVPKLIYQNPSGSRRVIPLRNARKYWGEFKNLLGWNQLLNWAASK